MTTEAPTTAAPTTNPYSAEERLARIEANQEIIIELLREQSAMLDAMIAKLDTVNAPCDTTKPRTAIDTFIAIAKPRFNTTYDRIFFAVVVLYTLLGSFLVVQLVNQLT